MDDPDMTPESAADVLDLRGLRCPLPVLHTRRALRRLAPDAVVAVRSTDPLAGVDIPNLVRETGDTLVATASDGEGLRFVIRKAGPRSGSAGSNAESRR